MVEDTKLWLTGGDLSCLIELVNQLRQNLEIEPGGGKAFGRRDIDVLLLRLQEAYDRIGKHCQNCRHFDFLNRRCQLEGWRTQPDAWCTRFEPDKELVGGNTGENGERAKT